MDQTIQEIVSRCQTCQQTNTHTHPTRVKRVRLRTREMLKRTEMKTGQCGYRYSLVFVDAFPGWVGGFPIRDG